MKEIYISISKAQNVEVKEPTAEEILNQKWQEFLVHVVDSIEERRKLLKPSSFRSKGKVEK